VAHLVISLGFTISESGEYSIQSIDLADLFPSKQMRSFETWCVWDLLCGAARWVSCHNCRRQAFDLCRRLLMRLLAILGSVTPPGRLLSATQWLLDDVLAAHKELDTELLNLADKRISFADGRPPDQYRDDTAAAVHSVEASDAVIIASPVYRGSITGALKNLLDHLPVESLAAKPVGIVAMGATQHHFLGVDWHLRDILAWFGALMVPTSVYLASADFVAGELAEGPRQDLRELVGAVIRLTQLTPGSAEFLGPKPLAARRS
jgi:FMN reductase